MAEGAATFRDELRQYRLDHRLTWDRFGHRAGVSASALWKIVHGHCSPHELTEHTIRERLGLPKSAPAAS